jgi:hypothetical protein
MKFRKTDAAYIASFKEGAFKSWKDIVDEVQSFRLESNKDGIKQAQQSLSLTFD